MQERKKYWEGGKKKKPFNKKKKEEANEGEERVDEEDDEHIVFTIQNSKSSKITFDSSEEVQATTSHVCNRCEAFTMFHPLTATTVTGVGNLETKAEGWGTVWTDILV